MQRRYLAKTPRRWRVIGFSQGAEWLHVVNLDGALSATQAQLDRFDHGSEPGEQTLSINLQRLAEIRRSVEVPIQFGGGLRTVEDIRLALELGADRVVLGTVAVKKPRLVAAAVEQWGPERVAVGIDARDGKVATHGWQETSHIDAVELGHRVHAMGIRRVVYTDISRDGMLSGVNVEATARLGDVTGLSVIASGGVAGMQDVELLKAHEHFNIGGVIVGQALYTGNLDLPQSDRAGSRTTATSQRRSCSLSHDARTDRSSSSCSTHSSSSGSSRVAAYTTVRTTWPVHAGSFRRSRGCASYKSMRTVASNCSMRRTFAPTKSTGRLSIIWRKSSRVRFVWATRTTAKHAGSAPTRPGRC